MPYAAQTRVPISKTKTDIKELLARHGATGLAYATEFDPSPVRSGTVLIVKYLSAIVEL